MIEIIKSNWQLVVSLAAGILWLLNAYKTILEIIYKRKEIKLIELQIDEKKATNIIALPRVQELKNTIRVTEEQIKVLGKNLTIATGIIVALFSISLYAHFESKELRKRSIANLRNIKVLENQIVYLDSLNKDLTDSTSHVKEIQNLQAYNNLLLTSSANKRDSISILLKSLRDLRRKNYELAQKIEYRDSIILELKKKFHESSVDVKRSNIVNSENIIYRKTEIPIAEKPRIAIVDFQIKDEQGQKALGVAMSDLLIDALVETRRYLVVERSALQTIRQEQIMALSGQVDAATGAEVGKLIGAEYLVVGMVSKFEEKALGGGLGSIVGGTALGGVGAYTSELGITVRIINATTGEIVASEKINQKESSRGLTTVTTATGGSAGGGLYRSKSMQTAIEKAIVKAAEVIGEQILGGQEAASADSTGATKIEVVAKNVDFAISRLFAKTLMAINGVKDVKSSFDGNTANIKVEYQGVAEDLAASILTAEMQDFEIKIESLTVTKIVINIDKK